jgi:hypothetical protein
VERPDVDWGVVTLKYHLAEHGQRVRRILAEGHVLRNVGDRGAVNVGRLAKVVLLPTIDRYLTGEFIGVVEWSVAGQYIRNLCI